jgi:glycosyltransferase involved in cell wall biosynthesis
MYKVSILTPVYCAEKFIERCAKSLFKQNYANLEYVFVDDCSPDNSIALLNRVLEEYPNRKEQVKLIVNEKNLGASASKNIAVDNATGEFVSFVDADDWLELNAVELLVTEQLRTGADVVWGKLIEHTNEGDYVMTEPPYPDKRAWIMCYCQLTTGIGMLNQKRIIRRSLLKQHHIRSVNGFNYSEDKLLLAQVAYYANGCSVIDDVVYHYNRLNPISITSKHSGEFNLDVFRQDNGSLQCMEVFFSTKEPIYYQTLLKARMHYLKENLDNAVRFSSPEGFKEVLRVIDSKDSNLLGEIGWDSWKRIFYQNYYYMKYLPKIKRRINNLLGNTAITHD